MEFLERTALILGEEKIALLQQAHLLVVGLGGVGSYAAEALARMGVGEMTLVDHDVVASSNINRQLVALHSTFGQKKVQLMADRVRDINPRCQVHLCDSFVNRDFLQGLFQFQERKEPPTKRRPFTYLVDAIDSFTPKVALLEEAWRLALPTISSMGAGGKWDPSQIRVADLLETEVCPLAARVRKKVRQKGIGPGIKAVYSREKPLPPSPTKASMPFGRPRSLNGTVSYMPALFGLTLVAVVIQDILSLNNLK